MTLTAGPCRNSYVERRASVALYICISMVVYVCLWFAVRRLAWY